MSEPDYIRIIRELTEKHDALKTEGPYGYFHGSQAIRDEITFFLHVYLTDEEEAKLDALLDNMHNEVQRRKLKKKEE